MNFVTFLTVLFLFFSCVWSQNSSAEDSAQNKVEKLPLYEYGAVGLAAQLPHYRGSEEYHSYIFPVPYLIYRGERLQANRNGIRTIFLRKGPFETDLSLSGNPPASSDSKAREGMDDLDAILEIGPALRYYFYEYGERDALFLQANARLPFSFSFDDGIDVFRHGYTFDLALVYRDATLLKASKIRFHLSTGPQFGSGDFHDYFYGVSEADVTATRERYSAESGYGGWQLSGSIQKELTDKIRIGFYGRWMNSTGVVFDDSPLFETENNYVVGTLLIWKLGQSEELEK